MIAIGSDLPTVEMQLEGFEQPHDQTLASAVDWWLGCFRCRAIGDWDAVVLPHLTAQWWEQRADAIGLEKTGSPEEAVPVDPSIWLKFEDTQIEAAVPKRRSRLPPTASHREAQEGVCAG